MEATYLRCFVHACPTKWSNWLSLAEFWYNTSFHSSLNKTPFYVLYGHEPRQLGIDVENCAVDDLDEWLKDRSLMQQLLQQHLLRAQKKMKTQADKKRSDRSFAVGDCVYLELQPYVQSFVALRSSNKLCFRYFGPYLIIAKIGATAYTLKLPDESIIHPTFHVSQLKKAVPPNHSVCSELHVLSYSLQVPLEILDRRLHLHHDKTQPQVLVRWSRTPLELSTWEDEDALRQQFPRAPAWGQAIFQGQRNVTRAPVPPAKKDEDVGAI
ncbi:unnamed protein product [Miscanthus lutarioriparius]|uniref:Tf2-1-like SH3-like domain-containing protein n=1 Tax=Miscanthus lutarioriparius TaxID=422564 RepID=A0A811PFM7_9POAL|nr:unnamed protein product [Miscanthus lutarioriparius]